MGCINFEDHVLSKRRWACKKMNATCKTFEDEKNGVIVENSLRLLLEIVCAFEALEFTVA